MLEEQKFENGSLFVIFLKCLSQNYCKHTLIIKRYKQFIIEENKNSSWSFSQEQTFIKKNLKHETN
jgi:hypothetical protein